MQTLYFCQNTDKRTYWDTNNLSSLTDDDPENHADLINGILSEGNEWNKKTSKMREDMIRKWIQLL